MRLVVAALALFVPHPAKALDPTHDKILYVVADAHLDTQWTHTIQDTINSYIPSTLHANFSLFTTYPDYTFSHEQAFHYALAQEYYASDFATLSNYVAQGRWRVAGAEWESADVNVPSPESLIRQALYGNGFWKQNFGRTSIDIFRPDCDGFGYALPSIAAHCGIKGFTSWRCGANLVQATPRPFQNIGRWIGPDGASITAVITPGPYGQNISSNLANASYYYNRITNMYAASGLYIDYMNFGTGDDGGGPTSGSVNWLEQSIGTTGGLQNVISAGTDQLFRDLTPAQANQLPPYQGELLGTLGSGVYTSHPEMKKYNRQNEQRADAAERVSVVADWLQGGGTYPQQRLTTAWERFLWNQHHDIVTGVSFNAAYNFSWNDEVLALNEFGSETTRAAGVLAKALDTTAAGVPLVVYNPLAIAREDIVEAIVNFTKGPPMAVRVFDGNGNEVPSQMGTPTGNSVPVMFLADVPSTGAAVYDVRPAASPSTLNTGLSVSSSQLQNGRYTVQLNANGDVTSILDRVANVQLLSTPIRWDFLFDSTNSSAWHIVYNDISATPVSYLTGPATFQVLENGPARVTLAVIRNNAGSTFTERIRLAAGDAGNRVEWDLSIGWNTLQTVLKMEFPLGVSNPNATYDLGLGTIQRPNATSKLWEVPAQQWADLTSSDGSYGVTIMNDCRNGWDKPGNTTLRLTMFNNPTETSASSFPFQATNGFGSHRILVGLMGHASDWRAGGSCWAAARLNQPLQAFQTSVHTGTMGKSFSFLSCNNTNVMVKALKKAESSSEIVVRLQELAGQGQTAQLSFAAPIQTARQVTGAEDPITNLTLTLSGGVLTVPVGSNQPVAVALTLGPPATSVPKPASVPVTLPFNLDAISTDGNRTDGNFDSGYTYPAELIPTNLLRDGVSFRFGPTNNGAYNALACQGQTIPLSAGGYNQLYFLAASASTATTATFTVGAQSNTFTVPYFTGFIGQWSPPSILTNQDVAWVCTHRHNGSGNNDAYNFCYLFKFRLSLPPNATSLTLPNAPNLRIFAMSLATNTTPETVAAGGPLAQPAAPWASAGPDQSVNATANGTATVTLDGSGSMDPDGYITSYTWTTNGTLLATGVRPVVTLPVGTNLVLLTVTDNQGQTAVDETTVGVAWVYYGQPQIAADLPAAVGVVSGKSYTYSIGVVGSLPLRYQWYSGTTRLAGQTNSSYTLTAGSPGSTASYFVVITNIYSAVTSSVSVLTVVAPLTDAYATNVLAYRPVGYWPLQETNPPAAVTMETNYGWLGAQGNAYYAVTAPGQTNIAFGLAGALAASGDTDPAVAFSGPSGSNYAFVPHSTSALTLHPPLTMECWLNSMSKTFADVISQGGVGDQTSGGATNWGGIRLCYAGNNGSPVGSQPQVQVYAYNGSGSTFADIATTASLLPFGAWYHCVMTFDVNGNVNLYLNGALQGSGSLACAPSDSVPLTIGDGRWTGGGTGTSRPYTGLLDEVAIYTNALTPAQITNHWLAGTRAGSNYMQTVLRDLPMLYYRMDCAGYTNASPALCPLALNYGSSSAQSVYLPATVPGGVAGPPILASTNRTVASQINGVLSCVDAGADPAFNPTGTQPFTAMTWFRTYPADGRTQTIMSHGGMASWAMTLMGTDGTLVWNSGAGSVSSTNLLNDGQWHFAAGVYDGVSNSLYVDGVLNHSLSASGSIPGNASDHLLLGGDPDYTTLGNNQRYFAGAIAQAGVFTNALTGAQIQQLYRVAGTPLITLARGTGNNLLIGYTGTLLSSTNVAGPYSPVAGAASPYVVPATNAQQFYRSENAAD
jgi:alpha-mannosidase